MPRMILIIMPIMALFILFATSLYTPEQRYRPNFKARVLPEFALPTTKAQIKLQRQDFAGQVSLLHVFASWCLLCRQELPFMQKLGKRIPLYGLLYHDDYDNVKPWFAAGLLPYRKLAIRNTDTLAVALGVYGTPETFIIDACGQARYRFLGPLTEAVWQQQLLPRVRQLQELSCV